MKNSPLHQLSGRWPKRNKIYSKQWASVIVGEFHDRYSRGWYLLASLASIGVLELFTVATGLLRFQQRRWEIFKRVVKDLDSNGLGFHATAAMKAKYVKFLWYHHTDEALDAIEREDG